MSKRLELTPSESDHLRSLLKKRADYLDALRELSKVGSKPVNVTVVNNVEDGTVLAEFDADPIRVKHLLAGAIGGLDLELDRLGVKVTGKVPFT